MRAAVLQTEKQMVMADAERPTIQAADQMLIRVRTVGVCGSEVHAFNGTHPFRKAPAIMGHEMAGDVVDTGAGVTRFRAGDRVIVDPHWPCGTCSYCRSGAVNLCPTKKVLGTQAWPGAFGEYIVAPQSAVFRLPDHLSYVQGSLIEPLTIGVHVARRAGVRPGESVAILGSGSIGGMVAGVCHAIGAAPIVVADIRQHCLDAARERLGATHDILLPGRNLVDEIMAITHGEGVDVVVIAADDPTLVRQAVHIAKGHARVTLVALLSAAPLTLMGYDLIKKELHMLGNSMCVDQDVEEAVALTASGRVDVEAIYTHLLPIEQAQRAMQLAATKDDGAIKVILTFDP
jgi:2-desacetyl-2-hydroxyethyl bacteriochlorophyllide A dehydrogenase